MRPAARAVAREPDSAEDGCNWRSHKRGGRAALPTKCPFLGTLIQVGESLQFTHIP